MRAPVVVMLLASVAVPCRAAAAQWAASVMPIATRVNPGPQGERLTEGYLAHPLLMGTMHDRAWEAHLTLNAEGYTLRRGELNTGAHGEGFVDRRHPHTYLHELMVGTQGVSSAGRWSVYAGRGFVPFGSDDPMVRPIAKYPINHHLAQILERNVAVAAVQYGRVVTELAVFSGDEPTAPGAGSRLRNFGDSWSTRVTMLPRPGVEVSSSVASVHSPEHPHGQGLDQRKASVAARFAGGSPAGARYALLEWARTRDLDGSRVAYTTRSLLAEAALDRGPYVLSVRIERTDRPEEERQADPFRTPRPHVDYNILGITRWTAFTAGIARSPRASAGDGAAFAPFAEVARLTARALDPAAVFDPDTFYGSGPLHMLSAGARVRLGRPHDRMGRYGVARPGAPIHCIGSVCRH